MYSQAPSARDLDDLLRPSRMRWRDLLREAAASVAVSPARSVLVAIGTVIASAALVAVNGVSLTMSNQVTETFDALRATEVTVTPARGADPASWFGSGRMGVLRGVSGVKRAGVTRSVGNLTVTGTGATSARDVAVDELDAQALRIVGPRVLVGRLFDDVHVARHEKVILLSQTVASRLGVARSGASVSLDGSTWTVIGIYDRVERRPELLIGAVIPFESSTAGASAAATRAQDEGAGAGSTLGETTMLVETEPGAADVVARQAPVALYPEGPERLVASSPPEGRVVRQALESRIQQFVLVFVVIAFVMGTMSIAGAATSSIHARTGEIALRAVLGARPRHVLGQIVAETTLLGAAGSVVGVALGYVAVVASATWNAWTPVLDAGSIVLAVVTGAASGMAAGLLPAWRAVRLQPVDALRR